MMGIIARLGIVIGAAGQWAFIFALIGSIIAAIAGNLEWAGAAMMTGAGLAFMIICAAIRYILAGDWT